MFEFLFVCFLMLIKVCILSLNLNTSLVLLLDREVGAWQTDSMLTLRSFFTALSNKSQKPGHDRLWHICRHACSASLQQRWHYMSKHVQARGGIADWICLGAELFQGQICYTLNIQNQGTVLQKVTSNGHRIYCYVLTLWHNIFSLICRKTWPNSPKILHIKTYVQSSMQEVLSL